MKYLDLEGHLQKVLQSMLLFLSRTKLPGRQPSEVKFRSRPRLYNCGLVVLEVDKLFQAHKGNHVHRLPHGTNRICVPTGNWFYSRVINPGTLAGNGKQQICRSRGNGCCSRHPTKFRGKSGFQMNRSILKATISDILRLIELAWLQILAQHSSVYILGSHSQKIKSKENMLLFRPSVAHVFQTQCRFFHNLTRYLRVGAKKEKISSKHFQKKLLMDVITPHKSYLLKSSHIYLPGTILNSQHIYFI